MKNFLVHSALASMLLVGTTQVAFALPISTTAHLAAAQSGGNEQASVGLAGRASNAERVGAWLQRDDVRAQLVAHGVSVTEAQARLAVMSDQELASLNGQIDQLPAGGSPLAIIGIVFVVLLLLEVFGVTDIFKKI